MLKKLYIFMWGIKLTNLFFTPERPAPPPPPIINWLVEVKPRPKIGIPTDTLNEGQAIMNK